jgi:NAD(P)-dependent dehydrogenase (short-subunit alcohol dehydrogenase family)
MRGLAGKIAVVTGGARGIGRATVERFVEEGSSVAFLDLDEETGVAFAHELEGLGAQVLFLPSDVTAEQQVATAMQATSERFGALDVLVNNAGVNAYFDAARMTEAEWQRVFDVDLKGAWLCVKHALPLMLEHRRGSIVNIASIHAFMTTEGTFPYAAAKSGLVGLTRSLALDYGKDNIRVNAVCPGFVRTQLVQEWLERQPDPAAAERDVLAAHPLGRIGTPEEIASLVAYLASDDASYITGATLLVDGGLSARFAS